MENCECPVCLEAFERDGIGEPVVLTSCGHSVCRECCHQLDDYDSVICPLCRSVSIGSAANFPKNYALAAWCPITSHPRKPVRPITKTFSCVHPLSCSHLSRVDLDTVRERLQTVVILKMLVELRDIHYCNVVKHKTSLERSQNGSDFKNNLTTKFSEASASRGQSIKRGRGMQRVNEFNK
mmetsp:Transcript_17950/g.30032  ORF Transcript_17950/g.30032 Transcript_17950/m.30032 type:complete len:181 (-) Transcript_17950:162-704(-)